MLARLTALVESVAAACERREGGQPLAAVQQALTADYPSPTPTEAADRLDALASGFGLTSLDERLLTVAVAGEIDPNFALANGLLTGLDRPGWPTVALALELAGVPLSDPDARARLHPLAPLQRHGLVSVAGSEPSLLRRVTVPRRVAGFLLGDDTPEPELAPAIAEAWPLEGEPAAEHLGRALAAGVRLVWLRSPQGAVGSSSAVAGVEAAGLSPLVVDLARAPGGDLVSLVRAAVLEVALYPGHALVLLGAQRLVPREGPSVLPLLEDCVRPVVGVADCAWDVAWSPRIPVVLEAPRLSPAQRIEVWAAAVDDAVAEAGTTLGDDATDPGWADLLAMRLTPEEIRRASRDASLAAVVDERPLRVADLRVAARHLGSGTGQQGPGRVGASFEDLVLPDPALRELRRLVAWARHRDEVLSQGALQGVGGKGSGIAALFGGNPGTGKTLAANVVADELALDLLEVDLSSVVDKYVGETEKNLEQVFREAEAMNVVLFFDEADALFGSRSAVSDARDRYANLEVSYLLQRMEHFDGITILATNLRGNLDSAFTRRLQFLITFPDPDAETRERIWRRHLAHVARTDEDDAPDVGLLARELELAGGDIRNIVLGAAYDATEADDGVVGMRHLARAATRELGKLRKRPPTSLMRGSGQSSAGTPAAP